MSSTSTQFATSARMGMYDPIHQVSMWESMFRGDIIPNSDASVPVQIDARLGNKVKIYRIALYVLIKFGLVIFSP